MKKPIFKPEPGQIDYTYARWAPVVNCVLHYKGKILLVQRSAELNFYPGYWSGVSGFLDDQRSLSQKIADEIKEEVGISERKIGQIQLGRIFDQEESQYKKTWIVHPALVEVKSDKIKLNWEAEDYVWLTPKEARKFKLLPGFKEVLKSLTSLMSR